MNHRIQMPPDDLDAPPVLENWRHNYCLKRLLDQRFNQQLRLAVRILAGMIMLYLLLRFAPEIREVMAMLPR